MSRLLLLAVLAAPCLAQPPLPANIGADGPPIRLPSVFVGGDSLAGKLTVYNPWELRTQPRGKSMPRPILPKQFANEEIYVNITVIYTIDSQGGVKDVRPYSAVVLRGDNRHPIDPAFVDLLIAHGALPAESRSKPLDAVRLEIGVAYAQQLALALQRWTYSPGIRNGQYVAVRMVMSGQQLWAKPD